MLRKLLTYAGGSLVATGCSALALAVLYGLLHLSPGIASVLAWLAGALPNYWLNRAWTWQRRDRPDLRREVLPYVVVVLVTLGLSALCTHLADAWLRSHGTSAAARVGLVDVVFVGVFVVMSLLRFVLLDRLFEGLHQGDRPAERVVTPEPSAFEQATGRSLEDSSGANQVRYRAFQLELMRPHVGASLLEVGSGLGEFASQFEGLGLERHVVTDVDAAAVEAMAERFAGRPEVEARRLDLAADLDVPGRVATALAVNVLEHIDDDAGALRRLAALVEPGGTVVIWVPGYERLYGDFDRAVGHVRRYTPTTLRSAFVGAGLDPVDVRPVNFLGAFAWWAAVRRGGVGAPNPRLVRVYDRFVVPTTRFLERRITPPFGQSILGVARVPLG